jgi:class 3 adenylate cyclase
MAIFNAPHPQPDHALRAARAALAMQRPVKELPSASSHPQFRVGLNSGPALVGNIGGAEMRNFAAIGDTTNLAARLQTYAAEVSIVIGGTTNDRKATTTIAALFMPI